MGAATYIGLIRAIGPLTHARMSMAALRNACTEAGFEDVATVLATGNVLFRTGNPRKKAQAILQGVVNGFGLDNAVILVTPDELADIVAANPFPEAADRGSELLAFFLAGAARDTLWIDEYEGPERLWISGLTLYADYKGGVSVSKLTPARIEKRLGVTTTFRNWNTVGKLLQSSRRL